MNKETRLIIENQKEIMEFLLYPNYPESLIKQKNKIIELLIPKESDNEQKIKKSLTSKGEKRN